MLDLILVVVSGLSLGLALTSYVKCIRPLLFAQFQRL
jgi:hypothetical protein